jgi:hypothetical protein
VQRTAIPLAFALAIVAFPSRAQQGDRDGATLVCDRAADVGRVRCEVEARVEPGASISWGDVVLVRVPPFAAALRGRIGSHEASVHEAQLWRWTFALVARAKGSGAVEGRVRIVVCREGRCAPREIEVSGRMDVGP